MKVAAAQISCVVGDADANLATVRDFCVRAKASGAELIVFPEMVDTGYVMRAIREHASEWTARFVPQLQRTARELSLSLVCGVSEREGECIYNSQVVIDTKGEITGKYRKTHLFSPAPIEEDKCFAAGNCISTVSIGKIRAGLSICYDLRFPEVYRRLAIEGNAHAFLISSAWPFPRVEHLRVLAAARAIENQSYVVLANRAGTDDGVTFCGSSAIIDPYGVVIASASADREELVEADISEPLIQSVRDRMPVFQNRRPDVYAR